jgi:hypothetical protein
MPGLQANTEDQKNWGHMSKHNRYNVLKHYFAKQAVTCCCLDTCVKCQHNFVSFWYKWRTKQNCIGASLFSTCVTRDLTKIWNLLMRMTKRQFKSNDDVHKHGNSLQEGRTWILSWIWVLCHHDLRYVNVLHFCVISSNYGTLKG